MQISPVSAFKLINFKGAAPHTDPATGVSYDEGQPYLRANTSADTFVRKEKEGAGDKINVTKHECTHADDMRESQIKAGTPGFRHEDFLY